MRSPKLQVLVLFVALLLLSLSIAIAADAPEARVQELAKKRVERRKAFLLRSTNELGETLAFANEIISVLNEQVEAEARMAGGRAHERQDLLEWYQKYVDWLSWMSAEFDLEVSNFFSEQKASTGWTSRYEDLAKGSRKLAHGLGGMLQKLESEKKKLEARMQKINTAVLERRVMVDKDDLEIARELWPSYRDRPYDRSEAIYKDLTDEEVLFLRNELRQLGERQKYFECVSELEKYEQVWLSLKSEEFEKLHELAIVIGGNDAGRVAYAVRSAIGTYEADRIALRRKSGELDVKNHGISKTGTLKTLERLEELSGYYERMKYRYERHVEWLGFQIGSYEADLVELTKEL
jgi:hypothetical protein